MADALISVAGVTVSPGVRSNTVRWTVNIASCLPYLQLAVFEVWSATTNNRAGATKVGDATDLSFTHQGLLIGVARYYWVRAKDASGQYSDFFPLSATSGVVGVPTSTGTNSVGSDELADNSVGGNHLKADSVTASTINVTNLAAISATLGNVSVDGDVIVNGTISAGKYANLSIGTSKVADNAMSNADAALTTGNTTLSANSTNESGSVQSLSFEPDGGKLLVKFIAQMRYIGNGSQDITFRLKRAGSTVRTQVFRCYSNTPNTIFIYYIDTSPGSSSRNWTVTMQKDDQSADCILSQRYLECLNVKK